MTAIEWLATYLKGITTLNCDDIIDKAKQMERQQITDALMDIDFDLMMMEDHAHGEVGNDITKLRIKISEILKNK